MCWAAQLKACPRPPSLAMRLQYAGFVVQPRCLGRRPAFNRVLGLRGFWRPFPRSVDAALHLVAFQLGRLPVLYVGLALGVYAIGEWHVTEVSRK